MNLPRLTRVNQIATSSATVVGAMSFGPSNEAFLANAHLLHVYLNCQSLSNTPTKKAKASVSIVLCPGVARHIIPIQRQPRLTRFLRAPPVPFPHVQPA